MDKRKKIELQNTAEQAGAVVGLAALALVASAVGPIANTVQQTKKLKKTKANTGEITMADLKEALMSYATNFLPVQRNIIRGTKEMFDDVVKAGEKRLADYDHEMEAAARQLAAKQEEAKQQQEEAKRQQEINAKIEAKNAMIAAGNMPEELEKSGVATVLTLIDNAPDITYFDKVFHGEYRKLEQELNLLTGSNEEHEFIIKIGNVFISKEQHTVYMRMSDNSVKTLVFPSVQFHSIAKHTYDRAKELRKAAREANIADFTAAVNAQMAQNTK